MSASIPGIWETPAQLPLMLEAEILQILPALPDSRAGEGLSPLFFWEKLFIKEKKKNPSNPSLKLQRARVSMTPEPWDRDTPLGVGRPEFQSPAPGVVSFPNTSTVLGAGAGAPAAPPAPG